MTSPYLNKPLRTLEQAQLRATLDSFDHEMTRLRTFLNGVDRQVKERTKAKEARHG